MAYTANIVTVAEMQFMAGENVDATGDVEANHIILQDWAEAYLSDLLGTNLGGTGFSDLDSTLRTMISEWAACFGGNHLIKFNMAGYTTRQEAEDIIDVNLDRMAKIEKRLIEGKTKTNLGL